MSSGDVKSLVVVHPIGFTETEGMARVVTVDGRVVSVPLEVYRQLTQGRFETVSSQGDSVFALDVHYTSSHGISRSLLRASISAVHPVRVPVAVWLVAVLRSRTAFSVVCTQVQAFRRERDGGVSVFVSSASWVETHAGFSGARPIGARHVRRIRQRVPGVWVRVPVSLGVESVIRPGVWLVFLFGFSGKVVDVRCADETMTQVVSLSGQYAGLPVVKGCGV